MRESVVRRKPKGAPKAKAKLFEFDPEVADYLASQAKREGKTMVQFVQELIQFRKSVKTLPKI